MAKSIFGYQKIFKEALISAWLLNWSNFHRRKLSHFLRFGQILQNLIQRNFLKCEIHVSLFSRNFLTYRIKYSSNQILIFLFFTSLFIDDWEESLKSLRTFVTLQNVIRNLILDSLVPQNIPFCCIRENYCKNFTLFSNLRKFFLRKLLP